MKMTVKKNNLKDSKPFSISIYKVLTEFSKVFRKKSILFGAHGDKVICDDDDHEVQVTEDLKKESWKM